MSNNNQAFLIAKDPKQIKCVIFTEELGPVLVESRPLPNMDKPCISSLALIDVERFTSTTISPDKNSFTISSSGSCIPLLEESLVEKSIMDCSTLIFFDEKNFKSKLHENGGNIVQRIQSTNNADCEVNEKFPNHINEVHCLQGLKQRLLDASMAITNGTTANKSRGDLELFVLRSEHIIKELITTLNQHRQRKNNELSRKKRSRTEISSNSASFLRCVKSPAYYGSLYKQCMDIEKLLKQQPSGAKTNILDINDELTKLNITYHDKENRSHELIIDLTDKFPTEYPILTADLPIEFTPVYFKREFPKLKNTNTSNENESLCILETRKTLLPSIFIDFSSLVSKLQPFWEEMDDIDANCLILEPSLPARRSYSERRIALSEAISIHLEFDPINPRSSPISMRLSGASEEILNLRKSYQNYVMRDGKDTEQNESYWNHQLSIRSNLENCFGLKLPSPVINENLNFNNECGICYTSRLFVEDDNGEYGKQDQSRMDCEAYPDITCLNPICGRKYHTSCLLEWLQSLPNARVSFDRIHGTCMYCCEPISVKISRSS